MKKWLMISLILLLAGCAIGRKQDYRTANLNLNSSTHNQVAVAVQDRRPYILNKETEEDYVGMQRGGYGNPFDVKTQSRQPLALEMANLIAGALKKSGVNTRVTPLSPELGREAVLAKLRGTQANKLLLVTLREWQSDSLMNTEMEYDLDIPQEKAPLFFKEKMEALYTGKIEQALTAKP